MHTHCYQKAAWLMAKGEDKPFEFLSQDWATKHRGLRLMTAILLLGIRLRNWKQINIFIIMLT
jgi:hypothetical protein